jgi:uncharacterized protein (TIGR03083 family)
MAWPRLREEITATARRVGDLLRALPSGDTPLDRVDWTAAETVAHLVTLPPRYLRTIDGPAPMPKSLAEDNQRALEAVPERDQDALADRLNASVAELLDALGPDGTRSAYYRTVPHTAEGIGALLLNELLMHGLDLARAAGRPWPISREFASVCTRAVMPIISGVADPNAARSATGVYHLRLRGTGDWTLSIADGIVQVAEGKPARPDLHLSADPAAFMLTSFNHLSTIRAVLTGRMAAWGRKPWLAVRFSKAFAET